MLSPSKIALAAALAGLAGCSEQDAQQSRSTAQPIKVRSAEQTRLHTLDAFNLAVGLKRAIYAAGYSCKRVTDAGFVGEYKNLEMWTASCADRRNWAIFAGPDGGAQVRDCRDIPGTGLPECVIKKRPKGSFAEVK
jgi:hypothetical protein